MWKGKKGAERGGSTLLEINAKTHERDSQSAPSFFSEATKDRAEDPPRPGHLRSYLWGLNTERSPRRSWEIIEAKRSKLGRGEVSAVGEAAAGVCERQKKQEGA